MGVRGQHLHIPPRVGKIRRENTRLWPVPGEQIIDNRRYKPGQRARRVGTEKSQTSQVLNIAPSRTFGEHPIGPKRWDSGNVSGVLCDFGFFGVETENTTASALRPTLCCTWPGREVKFFGMPVGHTFAEVKNNTEQVAGAGSPLFCPSYDGELEHGGDEIVGCRVEAALPRARGKFESCLDTLTRLCLVDSPNPAVATLHGRKEVDSRDGRLPGC